MLRFRGIELRPFVACPPKREKTLRELIEGKYGTQAEAARRWGVTRAAVSKWTLGRKPPKWVLDDLGINRG